MPTRERNATSVISAAIAVLALVVAGIAVVVSNNAKGGGTASAATPTISITLSEFAITPNEITAAPGQVKFQVKNAGSLQHNFEVKGVGGTRNINPGETVDLTVTLKAGDYAVLCNVPGHETSGMRGSITVTAGATAGAVDNGSGHGSATGGQTPEQMDTAMQAVVNQFLNVNGLAEPKYAEKDWGKEGAILAPTILPDGTKQFELTAKVVDWEVEPGKIVKAWTYNGTVPGPTIKVNQGDHIRIILHNELPESTTLHPHGCAVPNNMDGFDPLTQEPIKPGESFTYDWVAKGPKVCMYHSHHDAQVQVPNGLVGALLVGDLDLPSGWKVDTSTNMVLNDAGTIGLSLNGRSFPGTAGYIVKQGQTMLVNYFNEGLQIHPMHLHAPHGLVIAKDGVELASPFYADTIDVTPGERWSVLYKFDTPGVWAWHCHILTHAETPTGFHYMATAIIVQ